MNQKLLNQVRTTDIPSLSSLMAVTTTETPFEDRYVSTDERELAAWKSNNVVSVGDTLFDEDVAAFRSGL